jgi:hypothetical protein
MILDSLIPFSWKAVGPEPTGGLMLGAALQMEKAE